MDGGDPIKGAAGICFAVAVLSGLAAGLVWSLGFLPPGAALLCLAECGLYVALGVGILHESRLAAYAAATLYTATTVGLMSQGLFGVGLFIRIGFMVQLWRAVFQIDDLKHADRVGAARRASLEAGPRPHAAPPALVGPRPTGRLQPVPGGVLLEAPALEPKRRTGRPMRGVRTCWTCKTDHPQHLVVCPSCRRDLFDA